MSKVDRVRARAGVYLALAEALVEPAPDLQELLLAATLAGARLANSDACQLAALELAQLPIESQARRQVYQRIVGGNGRRPLALYESLHRQGCLAGPATQAVERRYGNLGLHATGGEPPDHASTELAFLGYLAEAEADALVQLDQPADQLALHPGNSQSSHSSRSLRVRLVTRLRAERHNFLRVHAATWLPALGDALVADGDRFYAIVGHLLREFLLEEQMVHRRSQAQRVQSPVLLDIAACTLCGLCTGICPTRALRILEDRQETALSLDPTRCVACARCVRTCPEAVLVLAAEDSDRAATASRMMRRSPRAACPVCGKLTVSQAELNAVFSRLQAGAEMESLLSLCVACKAVI
jgi:ferredoxin